MVILSSVAILIIGKSTPSKGNGTPCLELKLPEQSCPS
jgi:hypothetical protein